MILAPFGLEGTLTGREWSDADAGTARLLDAWRQLYPLEQGCGAVEVLVLLPIAYYLTSISYLDMKTIIFWLFSIDRVANIICNIFFL